MKIYLVTEKGVVIPCTIKNNIIRPLVNGGYKILRESCNFKTKEKQWRLVQLKKVIGEK